MAYITKIYGPPGTGKTTRLISLLKMEIERGVKPWAISYISHTRAAGEVIKERFVGKYGGDTSFPWFRTIHSAAMRLIGINRMNVIGHYDYKNFSAEFKMPLTPQSEVDQIEDFSDLDEDYGVVLKARDMAEATCRDLDTVISERGIMHKFLTRERRELFLRNWTDYKRSHDKYDFTDMLLTYLADDKYEPLPCSVVFIDEAQDLSDLQWRVVNKMMSRAERIYMAGDDDQAIYGFIGGSEDGFFNYPADEEIVLEKSYRVPQAIGQRADRIIRTLANRKEKKIAWKGHPGDVERASYEIVGAPWREWQAEGKSVMVLTRHRKGAKQASAALTAFGIPHAADGISVLETPEAQLVRTICKLRNGERVRPRLVADLYAAAGKRHLEKKMRSVGARNRSVTISAEELEEIDVHMPGWWRQFARSAWSEKRFLQLRKIVNENGFGVLEGKASVLVCTMHAAKGREADIVVLLPDCTPIVKKNILRPAEVRLAYVSLTRAKEKAIVLAQKTDTFIDHLVNV